MSVEKWSGFGSITPPKWLLDLTFNNPPQPDVTTLAIPFFTLAKSLFPQVPLKENVVPLRQFTHL
ncbi:hypothetical protein Z947_45 [Sulfitobacter geojensis]|nr:hypothetical protein Z947_45 [Sulfitobacter geojensis]